MKDITPARVLAEISSAIPVECYEHIVIVGSLAAGYLLLDSDRGSFQVRTKDVDCLLIPHVEAVGTGRTVAQTLLDSGWTRRKVGEHRPPGTSDTPDSELPAVRLYPPGTRDWFLELLAAPGADHPTERQWHRIVLATGHFGLPSFRFLALAAFEPRRTEFGIFCARPEMLVLANLLEHQKIGNALMSGPVAGRRIKRSNKDLGRVLAIAWLSSEADIAGWPPSWKKALEACFPEDWRTLARHAGDGLRMLVASEPDLEEAFHTCSNGLLAHRRVNSQQLGLAGERLFQDAIEPLAVLALP